MTIREYELAYDVEIRGVIRVQVKAGSLLEACSIAESRIQQVAGVDINKEVASDCILTEISVGESSPDLFAASLPSDGHVLISE